MSSVLIMILELLLLPPSHASRLMVSILMSDVATLPVWPVYIIFVAERHRPVGFIWKYGGKSKCDTKQTHRNVHRNKRMHRNKQIKKRTRILEKKTQHTRFEFNEKKLYTKMKCEKNQDILK